MTEEDVNMLDDYEADLVPGQEDEDADDEEMAMYTADCARRRYPGHRYYCMYHGTTWVNAMRIKQEGFIPSPDGMLGCGVYVSRSFKKAQQYPLHLKGQNLAVLVLNVRVGKVKRINYQGHPLQKTWHSHGYDTAWVPPKCGMTPSGLEEDCVYDPSRIRVLDILPNRR